MPAGINVATLHAKLLADTTQFTGAMNAAGAQGGKFGALVKKAGKAGAVALVAAGASSLKMGADFQSSMAKIKGLVGATDAEIRQMSNFILKLGPQVGKSPKELAEAMFFLKSAGLDTSTAMKALRASAKASAAGLGETKVIADAVSSAIGAYGKENISASKATDVLVGTVKAGKLEASELAGVIGRVLPIASELGVTFEDVGGAVAALSRSGASAAEAITGVRGIMSKLLKPTEMGKEALQKVGLSADNIRKSIREKGLLDTLVALRSKFKGNSEQLGKVFEDIEALNAVLSLTRAGGKDTAKVFDAVKNSTGLTDEAFKAASDTMSGRLAKASAFVQAQMTRAGLATIQFIDQMRTGTGAGGQFASTVSSIARPIGAVVKEVAALARVMVTTKGGVTALGSVVGALVGRMVALGVAAAVGKIIAFAAALKNARNAVNLLTAAMARNPIGALGVAIGAVVGALATFGLASRGAKTSVDQFNDALNEQRDAMRALKDVDLDGTQRRIVYEQATINVRRAEKELTAARKESGRGSLRAQQAELDLRSARLEQKRAGRDLGRIEEDNTKKRERGVRSTRNTIKEARGRVRTLQEEYLNLIQAGKGGDELRGALNRLRSAQATATRLQRELSNALKNTPRNVIITVRATFEGVPQKLRKQFAGASAFIGDAVSKSSGMLDRLRKQLQDISSQAGKQQFLEGAIKSLDRFLSRDKKSDKLHRSIARVRNTLKGMVNDIERTKIRTDAFSQLRSQIEDKLGRAVENFRAQWERTMGRVFDKGARAQMSAFDRTTSGILAGFDAETRALIEQTSAFKTLKAEQNAAATQSAQEEQDRLAKNLAAAQAAGDTEAIAEAQREIAKADRAKRIAALEQQLVTETARIEDARATQRQQLEEQRAEERIALEQHVADERGRIENEAADSFRGALEGQLADELKALEDRKQGYRRFVDDIRKILAPLGLVFEFIDDLATGIELPPAARLDLPKPRKKPKRPVHKHKGKRPEGHPVRHFPKRKRKRREHGGLVFPSEAYEVGEEGPEVFRPHVAGRIFSAAQAAGPTTINNNTISNYIYQAADLNENTLARRIAWLIHQG